MPNLRGKTWTTTTPANVGDAQYWEDHLISDAVAAKAASSVQSVNNTTPDAQGNVDVVALPDGGTVGQVLTKQSSADGDADWEDPASSGHTIEDEDGNTMPYQSTLQFENAEVTNDSVNNKTIVDCKGSKGDAATITVGTVTTLPAGSDATVTNSGTSSDAVFDFGIPKGADGAGAVDSVNGYTGVVVLDASDVGALPDSTTIPTKTSELDNDSGFVTSSAIPTSLSELSDDATHRLVTDAEKNAWDAKVSESLLKSTVGWTGKNLLENTAVNKTDRGITFTVDSKKRITLNGTQDGTGDGADIYINGLNSIGKRLKLSDYPSSFIISAGINVPSSITVAIWLYDINETFLRMIAIPTNSSEVLVDVPNDAVYFIPYVRVNKNQTVSNITVSYMLRDASITDDTYEPYHESVEEEIEQIYADNGVLGAKNFFKWDRIPSSPQSGLTITRNDDGSVSISGTASASAYIQLTDMRIDGTYIASGCPNGGSTETYELQYIRRNAGSTADEQVYRDFGDGVKIESVSSKILRVIVVVRNGVTINSTFYPMLRLASDPDDTYVPYAMTNRELTDAVFVKDTIISSSYNLNDVIETGIYNLGSAPTNSPEGVDYGMLIVQKASSSFVKQIVVVAKSANPAIYIRAYSNGTWSSWFKFTGTLVS